jgi:transcriptional regulator with XRE-family HTH domain
MVITEMSTLERLEDYEIRSEYGSESLKYDIAAVLVAARKMKNLTQTALANIAGVSQAYIAKLESGEANPTIGRIGAILASIWLKAEINLMPLVSTFDAGTVEQKNTVEEASLAISAKLHSEIEQWIQRQIQHIEQQDNQRGQAGKIVMGSFIFNRSYIPLNQPAIVEACSGLVAAIQPPVIASENGFSSSNIGAGAPAIQPVA